MKYLFLILLISCTSEYSTENFDNCVEKCKPNTCYGIVGDKCYCDLTKEIR